MDCDLPAFPTKHWLTGCYRSHLRPLTLCKILDICVYIKEGIDGGSGVSTASVCRVPVGWMRTVRGSGRHLIKTVAAHLRRLDFTSLGWGNGTGGWVWAWMEDCGCVFVWEICSVPQMGWAYVCGFQRVCRCPFFYNGHFTHANEYGVIHISIHSDSMGKIRTLLLQLAWNDKELYVEN